LKQYDANIIEGKSPLEIGFDEARNQVFPHVKTDWILWIDSDEELLLSENLHKYLRANPYKGYGIRQHHFSTRPPNCFPPDIPVRVFRNTGKAKWCGVCHEHVYIYDESGFNFENGVGDSVILNDLEIAHDGYLTEEIRRDRFQRNFNLVQRDRAKYPERILGKFLYIRDLLHLARYDIERNRGRLTQQAVSCCELAVDLYQKEFLGKESTVSGDGITYYSEALLFLGRGLEYVFGMGVGPKDTPNPELRKLRFDTKDDYLKYVGGLAEATTKPYTSKYY
jgi:glycosyltransferase involved in cell wall biosynthesis